MTTSKSTLFQSSRYCLTILVCFALHSHAIHAAKNPLEFFVSPDGDDAANGRTESSAFRTLEGARDALRALEKKDAPVQVWLLPGHYLLSQSFKLNEQDSGTQDFQITYAAVKPDTVHISGGRYIPFSQAQTIKDPQVLSRIIDPIARSFVRQVDLRSLAIHNYGTVKTRGFRRPYVNPGLELFIGDQAYYLARWPNSGFTPIGKIIEAGSMPKNGDFANRGAKFNYLDERHSLWESKDDIFVSGNFGTAWADDTLRIKSIDNDASEIELAGAHLYGVKAGTEYSNYFVKNLFEELDRPGEYYVDRKNGILYFYPHRENLSEDLAISLMDDPLIVLENVEHVVFKNLIIENSRGIGIYLEGGERVKIQGCKLRNLGTIAICMGRGIAPDKIYRHNFTGQPRSYQLGSWHEHIYENSTFNRNSGHNHLIESCDIYNTGAGGISMGGGNRLTLEHGNNIVRNCDISDYNRLDRTYRAGINLEGVGNIIENNHIHQAPDMAIYLHGNEHTIRRNHVHHVMQESNEGGWFYMGRDPSEFGNKIYHNFVHHVAVATGGIKPERTRGSSGIYIDDWACGTHVYGNLFYRVGRDRAAVVINGGNDNTIEQNIFVDCRYALYASSPFTTWNKEFFQSAIAPDGLYTTRLKAVSYQSPPYSNRYPTLVNILEDNPSQPKRNRVSMNAYVNCEEVYKTNGEPKITKQNNAVFDALEFKDPAALDFSLPPDSVLYQKLPGFSPIPLNEIGTYTDTFRKKVPDREDCIQTREAQAQHEMIGVRQDAATFKPNLHPDAQWFPRAGFGLFIHWGLHTVGNLKDVSWPMIQGMKYRDTRIEDPAERERILREQDYQKEGDALITPNQYFDLAKSFNPSPKTYDPEQWIIAAKQAGFTYAVLTVQHHEGFSLWPSDANSFNTKLYAQGRDLVRPFVEACRKHGLKVGLYYSPPNWHFDREHMNFMYYRTAKLNPELPELDADLQPRNKIFTAEEKTAHQNQYAILVRKQVEELLTRYGSIDLLWFDGRITDATGKVAISRERILELQPGIIMNPRLHNKGDFRTYETHLNLKQPTQEWAEFCDKWTYTWGYNSWARFRDNAKILSDLARCRSLGINYLLSIGPDKNGELSPAAYKNIAEVADWMRIHRAAINGSYPLPKGESASTFATASGNIRYLFRVPKYKKHSWKGPFPEDQAERKDEILTLKGSHPVESVKLLSSNTPLPFKLLDDTVEITLPKEMQSELVDVVALTLKPNPSPQKAKLSREAFHNKRKASMSPDALAWEKILEAQLGDFYLKRYLEDKFNQRETAWDYVEQDPNLKSVLLIGDSISRAYTRTVQKELSGIANIHRAPTNCGPTSKGLRDLDIWLQDRNWDIIHFNFGIHDRNTKDSSYEKNLEAIITRLKKTYAQLIWASSTPLNGSDETYPKGSMVRKNEVAASLMKNHRIPINNLYQIALPLIATQQSGDGCHFREPANEALGRAVANIIKSYLK